MMRLTGRLVLDHKTIADYRRENEPNRPELYQGEDRPPPGASGKEARPLYRVGRAGGSAGNWRGTRGKNSPSDQPLSPGPAGDRPHGNLAPETGNSAGWADIADRSGRSCHGNAGATHWPCRLKRSRRYRCRNCIRGNGGFGASRFRQRPSEAPRSGGAGPG